jgi:hypothetical protein
MSVSLMDNGRTENIVEGFFVLFQTLRIASFQQHEQEGLPGALRPFALDCDHPLKGFFVQNLMCSSR